MCFRLADASSLRPKIPLLVSGMMLEEIFCPHGLSLAAYCREFFFVFSQIKLLNCLLLVNSFFNLVVACITLSYSFIASLKTCGFPAIFTM